MDESRLISERLSSLVNFCKKNISAITYVFLAIIVWLAVWIRLRPTSGLRDITTGGWTLGPDLDPFLFLRWAKDIVANGTLYAIDTMRYSPIGFDTRYEFIFLSYLIAWFHKIAAVFGSTSVEQSASLFPVAMFALTVIAFFFFVRKLFSEKAGYFSASIIALVSSLFLSVIPTLLPRTIAGIPEKESVAFFFMFLAFYFVLCSWDSKTNTKRYIYAILAGLATGGMGLIWGGVLYILLTLSIAFLAAFLLGQINNHRIVIFPIWIFVTLATMMPFSARYTLSNILASQSTLIPLAVCFIIGVHYLLNHSSIKSKVHNFSLASKIPSELYSLIIAVLLGVIIMTFLQGPSFIIDMAKRLIDMLIHPFAQTRFNITVAENRMPYFSEWAGSFGPIVFGIPITFWLMFAGSIYLFWNMTSVLEKKAQRWITSSYFVFLFALIFSRHSSTSVFNGENFISNLFYFGGMLVFIGTFIYFYLSYHKEGKSNLFHSVDFGLLVLFSLFFLSVVSARGGVRLIMLLAIPAAIIVGYFLVMVGKGIKSKEGGWKSFAWILFGIILLGSVFASVQFTRESSAIAQSYVPSSYTQQWQKAMSWVRDNTPANAVFGHWWDYGYWLQSIGQRATVLDGGNSIVYWNYFMGRHALTGRSESEALSFLYAHNTTHFLIDSTDIGKYPAFSSIGSDQNYDRYSWITSFIKDSRQTQEKKNSSVFVYMGNFAFDDDLIYEFNNGTRIFIPYQRGGVAAVTIESFSNGSYGQPRAIAVDQTRQYSIPMRYLYDGNELIDFSSGLDASAVFIPMVQQSGSGVGIDATGSVLYLSNKTDMSQLARLYLYNEQSSYFRLVHSEDDAVVEQLKVQGAISPSTDFVFYGGVRGPIKIWEINYPSNIKLNSSYLETSFPTQELEVVSR